MATLLSSPVRPCAGTAPDCDAAPGLGTSPSSIASFIDMPCGAPQLPLVSTDNVVAVRAELAVRAHVEGVTDVRVVDTTDSDHVRQGATDGRAIAADGRQIQIVVAARSFAGKRPLARHRFVMSALKPMLDAGVLHSVQVKCIVPEIVAAPLAGAAPPASASARTFARE